MTIAAAIKKRWQRGLTMAARLPSFLKGAIFGVVLVFGTATLINETALADWLVAPLLVPDSTETADVIVVLGAGTIGDCVPNQNALRRVLLGVRLWRQQRAPLMLFTGGGAGSCPVAVAMANLARELGVPAASLRIETASRSTRENGELSGELLRGWGMQRTLVVTDRLHMRRANAVFVALGFDVEPASVPIYEGHNSNVSMLRAGLREYAALAYYRMRGWVDATARSSAAKPRPDDDSMKNTVAHPIKNPNGPVVLLGASYALGWDLKSIAGRPVINRGITGQQSFELLERFERDVASTDPRAVILWGFVNDIFRVPPGGIDQSLERIRQSYMQMIALARAKGIEPILATEVTIRPRIGSLLDSFAEIVGTLRGKEAYQDGVNRQVMAINSWLKELGEREGLQVLDFQSALAEPGGRRRKQFALPDGSHITRSGYDMLSSYAEPILERFFVAR